MPNQQSPHVVGIGKDVILRRDIIIIHTTNAPNVSEGYIQLHLTIGGGVMVNTSIS